MSSFDILGSSALFSSTWPIPAGSGKLYASGTTATCNVQGFGAQIHVGTPLYNCSLSFYYLLVVGFAFSDAQIKRAEVLMHVVPLGCALTTAIVSVALRLYNDATLWCWISSLPESCGNDPRGTGDCIRGDHAWIYRWAFYYGPVWFSVITVTCNMVAVTYLVWAKEKASKRFHFKGSSMRFTTSSIATTSGHTNSSGRFNSSFTSNYSDWDDRCSPKSSCPSTSRSAALAKKRKERVSKYQRNLAGQVFWQAFCYVLAFYATFIFPTTVRLMQTINKPVPYWVLLMMTLMLPIQGLC
jgi:hypothetical protein